MQFRLKPDYAEAKERYDAFWEHEIIDRAPVCIYLPEDNPIPVPEKKYESDRERWLDIDFRVEQMRLQMENTIYYADALPIAWPNMGPEIFSAWCGCGYNFGDITTWTDPCILDWEKDTGKAVFDQENPLFRATVDFTQKLLDVGKGNFIVGLTDFHPGGDHLAALRDPEVLAVDMIENVEWVKHKLENSYKEYYRVYDIFYDMLRAEGMPITSWTPLIWEGKFYIPSNDFSCMISTEMFESMFVPGIIDECEFYERSIYHLDGPGALRHLDTLLNIENLDAIQWVPGAGNDGYEKWIGVYQKIQKSGKGIQLGCTIEELPRVFETLRPEGVWFASISGIDSRETADKILDRIEKWK